MFPSVSLAHRTRRRTYRLKAVRKDRKKSYILLYCNSTGILVKWYSPYTNAYVLPHTQLEGARNTVPANQTIQLFTETYYNGK